ncbi:LuxR C-terminal-related transcriptional regulator [Leptolyngbya sp. NK1-12]
MSGNSNWQQHLVTAMAFNGSASSNSLRLLMDLQQVSQMAQAFSGCLDPTVIAKQVTDQIISVFDCAFARIWLVEADQTALRLVASSGLYTHTDGSFSRVAMGAYKVGKIAQNRIPFLSNHLAEEPWVKDREWAIAEQITGFAGYPLAVGDRVVGVLAVFSHRPLSPEFLEVLQYLCATVTVALDSALAHQREQQSPIHSSVVVLPLSEQIATLLSQSRFCLVGTERLLPMSLNVLLLRTGEMLSQLQCSHCRLMYESTQVLLDAMVIPDIGSNASLPVKQLASRNLQDWIAAIFDELRLASACVGGTLQTLSGAANQAMLQVLLTLPYPDSRSQTSPLSDREQEMLLLLAAGFRDRDIADQLHISERTVKFHINNAIAKLQVQTRCQALYQAVIRGWLDRGLPV